MNSSEMHAFLTQGLENYVQAREAVDAFETEIEERLARVFEEKENWAAFKAKRGSRGRGKALWSGSWSGATGRTIWATQNSAIEGDGYVDLKLWWRSPRERDRVLICCGRFDGSYRLQPIELAAPHDRIRAGAVDQSSSHLYAVLATIDDIPSLGRALLDEMDKALAAAAARPRS